MIPIQNRLNASGGPIQLWQFLVEMLLDRSARNCIIWTGKDWEFRMGEFKNHINSRTCDRRRRFQISGRLGSGLTAGLTASRPHLRDEHDSIPDLKEPLS